MNRLLPNALLALVTASQVLPGQDPPVPPGGFPVRVLEFASSSPAGPITWIDGVRSEMDVYHPLHASPPSGWPTVLVIHGGAGSRKNRSVRGLANRLTARGYLCIAFDVRGDGSTPRLNPPGFANTEDDRLRDLADAIRLVPTLLPASVRMDASRIAISGDSQGGRNSLRAAAWSGQPLTAPVGPVTAMPVISASAPRISPLDLQADSAVDAHLANAHSVTNLHPKLSATDPIRLAIEAEDWLTYRSLTTADPLRNYMVRVATSTVPIQAGLIYEDAKHALYPHIGVFEAGMSAGPSRLVLSTSGHSTPQNAIEEAFTDDQIGAWFDRWLKGLPNGADDANARVQIGWRTDEPNRYVQTGSAWPHSRSRTWPPQGTSLRRLHLRGDGSLRGAAPGAPESGFTMQHRVVTAGYDIGAFCRQGRGLGNVVDDIPVVEHVFTGNPLPHDLAIAGRPTLELSGVTTTAAWQVTAALESIAPDGSAVQITSGTAGGDALATPGDVEVALDDVAFRVSAGHRLRLVVRNLSIHEPPGNRFLRWVPSFVDCDVAVPLSAVDPARLELPVLDSFPAALSPRLAAGSATATAGVTHAMRIEAGRGRAGQLFVVLMSGSGTAPGVDLPGAHVPLNLDAWTTLAASGTPLRPFTAFAGVLDGSGEARPVFDLGTHPAIASLVGLRFAFAAGGTEPGGATIWATDAAELRVLP